MPELSKDQIRKILKKVRNIEIRTHKTVVESMSGAYQSVFKGQGMDFEEVREYAPGDDVRSIDWNITAKMNKPFVKKFREERELTLWLLVDVSASGDFGSGEKSKREQASELAAVLAFSAIRNQDKVGLILFSNTVERFIPPKKGHTHVLRLIREILFFQPENKGTDIPGALNFLNQVFRRKSIVFLISDFLSHDGLQQDPALLKALRLTHRRHDLICSLLSDPREHTLPNIGLLELEDAETGETLTINTHNNTLLDAYQNETNTLHSSFLQKLKQIGISTIALSTHQPYDKALREFFLKRRKS
ncbi:MAG: hypothetical protein A2Y14_00460 [Verrucomicrobia bacterium GWF2_51_19]|nr:MAG: hypothetical protein A2Y14_00460 [Verrucomicrobia bacterium GWF2_51_19]HCJ12187.1 DUF58 domain-containing protein [Opitutae bacterium]